MDRKEAIEIVRKNYPHIGTNASEFETALRELVPELKESEDEKIRQALVRFFKHTHNWVNLKYDGDEIVAYLEKQKEQKPIPKFKVGDRIYDKRDSYNRNVIKEVGKDYYINAFAQKMDMAYTDANFEFLEHLDIDLIDSKPAEWSKEDEKMLTGIIERGSSQIPSHEPALREEQMEWLMNRLRSLRPQPHWKPSEEQMKALNKVANNGVLLDLFNDLLKLL